MVIKAFLYQPCVVITLYILVMTNVESKADSVHIWRILGGGMALLVIIIISVVVSVLYVIK